MHRTVLSVIFLACLAGAYAECGPLQRIKVKEQYVEATGDGLKREAFAQALWRAFFKQAPDARAHFARVGGDDVTSAAFRAHAMRVLGGFDICVSVLDDPSVLDAVLTHLHGQHVERRIPSNYFSLFGNALRKAVPAAIGRCYDDDAWSACYEALADKIKT